jgi:spermidine synthase
MDDLSAQKKKQSNFNLLLLLSVFVVATCGLIYELVAGTLASYLLGDSVTQFSLIIGVYLFSMGIGSFLSKFFTKNLLGWFIQIEILVGLIGGCSAAILFLCFNEVESFRILLFGLVSITGILVGLEIPILMSILKDEYEFRDLMSRVFSFDYVGALFASIIFPLLLVPKLGLIRTAFFFGILNTVVAIWVSLSLGEKQKWIKLLRASAVLVLLILVIGFVYSEKLTRYAEGKTYPNKIIFAQSTPYQRIILTNEKDDFRLYLNGNLQFSSRDEYRYHEALVHPAIQASPGAKSVLILGGGDGLAAREVCYYSQIDSITLVDLDADMTQLFQTNPQLTELNHSSFSDPRITVINDDAFVWLKKNPRQFDVIIVDFPDPSNYSLGKLYSTSFYEELIQHISKKGNSVIQSTSPLYARQSYWCIENTCRSAGFATLPYHAYVPSFGEWGYILMGKEPPLLPFIEPLPSMKFLNSTTWQQMQFFPMDMSEVPTEVNRLNNQMLVHYFEKEWSRYE